MARRETPRVPNAPLAGGLCLQRAQNPLGSHWNLIHAHAHRVVHRVGDRRHDRQQRTLSDFLRAERPLRIRMLDEVGEDLGHVQARRALVLEHRRKLVDERARQPRREAPERLLLHQRFAESHVDAAFDLPARERGIDRAADVVRDPHAGHGDPSRLRVDVNLDDSGRV
jgi:hypothetical protein